jgi:hypothetical protein
LYAFPVPKINGNTQESFIVKEVPENFSVE